MMSEMTVAKIGRSMKNLENMDWPLPVSFPASLEHLSAPAVRGPPPVVADSVMAERGLDRDRRARLQRQAAVDNHLVAGPEPFGDEPVIAVPVTDHHRPVLGLAVFAHHPDEVSLGPLLHRPLRHKDRVRPDGAFQAGTHILVRPQYPVRVIDAGPDEERSGLRIIGWSGKGDPSLVREKGAVDQDDFHLVVPVSGGISSFLAIWSRYLCISFSERLKFTQMGESTATVVSWLFCWLI